MKIPDYKLTPAQLAKRRSSQARSATLPRCVDCGQIVTRDSERCRSCDDAKNCKTEAREKATRLRDIADQLGDLPRAANDLLELADWIERQ